MAMEQDKADFFARVDWAFLGDKKPTLASDAETELAEGIKLVHLPGHTPGQMAMQLDLEHTGTVLLTSDALYHHDNYAEPVAAPQIYWEVDRWRRSIEKLKVIAKEHDALLFPGHDETGIQHLDGDEKLVSINFSADHTYS
jgi:N-acyl homoserine lactone hydrolase